MDNKLSIIHMDMDAFYASIEEMDNPSLKGKPLIVGNSDRGIVTTCNYEARKYGVHSAMPVFMAKKLCPHANFVPNRRERYLEISGKVFEIVYTLTEMVEKVSIDEAYIDISDIPVSSLEAVDYIRTNVKEKIGLTMSFGISYNKFLAKIASDWDKPEGLKIITEDMMPEILFPFPLEKVHGIGKKSAEKFYKIGVYTVKDLYNLDEEFLVKMLGKGGREVYNRIRGIDYREVTSKRERKSIGSERTFVPTRDNKILYKYLEEFSSELSENLIDKNLKAKTISVKIKYDDFTNHQKSRTFPSYIDKSSDIYEISRELFSEFKRDKKIRLIGITLSNLTSSKIYQLELFD